MSVVARKVIRQELMPTAVLDKIEREPLPVNTDRVRRAWTAHVSRPRDKRMFEHEGLGAPSAHR